MFSYLQSADKIFEDLEGYRRSAILATSIRLGIFDHIADGTNTNAGISQAIKAPVRSTRILLDALVAMKYLKKHRGEYSLLSISSKYLLKGSPQYLDGVAEFLVHPVMWEAMEQLLEAVKKGTTTLSQDAETQEHDFWKDFARFSLWVSKPASNAIGDLIKIEEYKQTTQILDLACGSGTYGFTLAKRNPAVQVVCVDLPEVLTFSKQNAADSNLEGRVTYVAGDIFKVDFGNNFDIAIASFIFHHFDLENCEILAKRISHALKPGGTLVLHDYIPDEERSDSYDPLLFAVLMLAWTNGGDTYTFSQYQTILEKAGFHRLRLYQITSPTESSLIIAQKH